MSCFNNYHRLSALWAIAFCAGLFGTTPTRATEIILHSQAVPSTTIIRLGDVARVQDIDPGLAARLANVALMPAPSSPQRLRARQIQDLLEAHGIDCSQLRFAGAAEVAVSAEPAAAAGITDGGASHNLSTANAAATQSRGTAGFTMPRTSSSGLAQSSGMPGALPGRLTSEQRAALNSQLEAAILDHVQAASGSETPWQVAFEVPDWSLERMSVATESIRVEGAKEPWSGGQRFLISFQSQLGPVRFPVQAEVSKIEMVAIAARPIERGNIITAHDVRLEPWPVPGRGPLPQAAVGEVDDLIGMEAQRAIREGEYVPANSVRAPILVRRNDIVSAVARGDGIHVRTQAKARQNGSYGDLIQVESLGTRKRYDAIVVGAREVAVFTGGVPAPAGVPTSQREAPIRR